MTKATIAQAARDEARVRLRKELKPGDTVHTVLRHVSCSGMMRYISPVIVRNDGSIWHPDWLVATALDWAVAPDRGIKVRGCGIDMGFELVYVLSQALFPDGFECPGEHCHSNDHTNGDRDYAPHHHSDGGYALAQTWI